MAARAASVSLCVALVCGAHAAPAQSHDPAAAEGLFRAGKAEMDAGHLDRACALFRQSREADGAPGTTFHLADCEERRGRLATAWALFGEAAQRLPAGDARIATVRARAAALEPRLPYLAIDLDAAAPAGTVVERDGASLGAAAGTFLPVDPGKHTIVVRAPGRATSSVEVDLIERERRRLPVTTGAVQPTASAGPLLPLTPAHADDPPGPWPTVGLVMAGVGVATVVAGVAVALKAQSDYRDSERFCSGDRCSADGIAIRDDARGLGTVATALTVVGAAGLAAGGVLWFATVPGAAPPGARAGKVSLRVTSRGVDLRGAF